MARVLLAKARTFGYGQVELVVPLGVLYLASSLREAGHEVRVYDCGLNWNDPEHFRRALRAFRPDVIGLSAITYEGLVMEGMARVAKETFPDVPVVAGGPHPSAYPERCARLGAIDFVAIGEGERTAVELVDALTRGGRDPKSVHGLAYYDEATDEVVYTPDRVAIEDVDAIPFPAWDLVDLRTYWRSDPVSGMGRRPHMLLFTSRGCPFKCIYCHEVQGKRFRSRSPENVMAEMRILRERFGVNDFEIVDDIFNFDRDRMLDLLDRVIASKTNPKFHFPNALRTDMLDEVQIDRLYRAGTRTICVAVETTSPRLQKLTKKHLKVDKVGENIEIALARGLYVVGFFMLGFPTETYEEGRGTIEWALATRLHHAHFNLVTPFAGTTLYNLYQDTLRERGIAGSDDIFGNNYHKGGLNLSAMTDAQLFGLQQEAYRRFMLDPVRAARVLVRHQGRGRLVAKAALALYYSFSPGRTDREKPIELAWTRAGIEADPIVAARERERRIEPTRLAANRRKANRVRLRMAASEGAEPER